MPDFSIAIQDARRGENLGRQRTSDLIDTMLRGEASENQIGELLLALASRGETVDELVGAASAMRRHMTPIHHRHDVLLDTCGTGGSGSGTFNISTAIAILVAACGVAVAKHGNRKATSLSGSADVLESLGVTLESDPEAVSQRLNENGLCFCFAPKLHPAMKHVIGVRQQLKVKTLFNLLGPLCNPARATHQLLGTSNAKDQTMIAEAIKQLGTRRSYVVHADDGQDEISLASSNTILEVEGDCIERRSITPEDFGVSKIDLKSLYAADPIASAKIITGILSGQSGPARDTVLAGSAVALQLVKKCETIGQGVTLASQAIDGGAAMQKLQSLY
jgi:anthranilate phosphoribosyltransferase